MSKSTTAAPAAKSTEKSSAEKRAATVESNRAARIAARGYALPLVLVCKVTGKEISYTSPAYISKVLSKFDNSVEKLKAEFVSREGRRILAEKNPKPAKPTAEEKAATKAAAVQAKADAKAAKAAAKAAAKTTATP